MNKNGIIEFLIEVPFACGPYHIIGSLHKSFEVTNFNVEKGYQALIMAHKIMLLNILSKHLENDDQEENG